MTCPLCQGELWLCEEHPDKPWPHDDCPGPGFACVCNPECAVKWQEVYAVNNDDKEPS